MKETYINDKCYYYDYGDTAPREYGEFCKKKKTNIKDANCKDCDLYLEGIIESLTPKEKEVLNIASNAIYFNDRADYIRALWEIVIQLSDNQIKDCNSKLFELLNNS